MAQVEEAELKQQQDFIKKARKKSIPRCTIAMMAVCTVLLILEYTLAYLGGSMEGAIVAVGGFYKMSIVAAHEYWRILSGGFVHND
ncbi:rhomboid family intramembrane serine protease, partial [Erysipelatoclostridium ramosum]|nr:rhomboid family intramembrane serine protease [Thomasclavelia ramosa]